MKLPQECINPSAQRMRWRGTIWQTLDYVTFQSKKGCEDKDKQENFRHVYFNFFNYFIKSIPGSPVAPCSDSGEGKQCFTLERIRVIQGSQNNIQHPQILVAKNKTFSFIYIFALPKKDDWVWPFLQWQQSTMKSPRQATILMTRTKPCQLDLHVFLAAFPRLVIAAQGICVGEIRWWINEGF